MTSAARRLAAGAPSEQIIAAVNANAASESASIAALSASVTTLSGTVTTLSGTVTALSGTVTALAATVAAIPPGMVKISDQTGTGASGTLTFSAIPGGYRGLMLHIFGRSTTAAIFDAIDIHLNGDTNAAHYFEEFIGAAATTVSGTEYIGTVSAIPVGLATGASSPAGAYGTSVVEIPEYAHVGVHKTVVAHAIVPMLYTSGNVQEFLDGAVWQDTAAISQIDIFLGAGNWTTDSRATLWALPS